MSRGKKKVILSFALVLCIVFAIAVPHFVHAEEVIVERYKDTSLQFIAIHGKDNYNKNAWDPIGSYDEDLTKRNYQIHSNAFAPWFTKDSVHFAYKKMDFAYGKQGTLVLETVLNSFNATESVNAGAGIMLRTSLDPGATNLLFHVRPNCIMVQYRPQDDATSIKGKTDDTVAGYPISFRLELKAGKVSCFIKHSGATEYSKFATVPFVCGNTVYAGIAAYSQSETQIATADYTGFDCYISVPEGTERVDGGTGDTPSENTPTEEEVTLPEDPAAQANVLMRETFTSGAMTHPKEELPQAPNWTHSKVLSPNIVTTPDNTDRYLYDWMEDGAYYYAGDQHWSDYTMTMDVTFTEEFSDEAKNNFYVFIRHTDIDQYGVHDYAVSFTKGNTVSIGKRSGGKFVGLPTTVTAADAGDIVSADFSYLPAKKENVVTRKLKIRAFDNVITVWIDNVKILQFTDLTSDINGVGSVGFMVSEAAVQIDNIEVIGEEDLLGGNYDNTICGNWNEPIPELVQDFADHSWRY